MAQAQYAFQWEELASMPFRTSNNAVSSALSNGEECIYSFMGIDSTKLSSGIHLRSFKYSPSEDMWEELASVPDTLGKIASAASTVDGIIYIMGGYHVFEGPPFELSSDKVHRFDPELDSFLDDGASIPVPIDDHVQCVWRDSLIFLVSGWSDVDFVPDVQIYNPFLDDWMEGTDVPSGIQYEHFGASGVIIGDTIYYHGGAVGGSFSASGRLRKGVIDPMDPTQISWTVIGNFTDMKSYRSGAVAVDQYAMWLAGSQVTYNYNGISYGGNPVAPLDRVLVHDTEGESLVEVNGLVPAVMDIRGLAQVEDGSFYLCGGMEQGQVVSDNLYHISFEGVTSIPESDEIMVRTIWPNPVRLDGNITFEKSLDESGILEIRSLKGEQIAVKQIEKGLRSISLHELGILSIGSYLISVPTSNKSWKLLVE
jgi:hypothetical protein